MAVKSATVDKPACFVDPFTEVNLFVYNGSERFIVLGDGKHRTESTFSGVVVNDSIKSNYRIGYHNTSWSRSQFKLYEGAVTLSN